MLRQSTIYRCQGIVLLCAVSSSLVYFAVFRPLAHRSVTADRQMGELWDQLVEINLRNKAKMGLDLETMSESQILAEKAVVAIQKAAQRARDRLALDPAVQERLSQPFQLLEYDQQRMQTILELQRLAQGRKVALEPAAIAGLPEYVAGSGRVPWLWAKLALATATLKTAILAGPAAIKSIGMLPGRSHGINEGARTVLEEFAIRIELRGSMKSILNVLASLPLTTEELRESKFIEAFPHKPALFLHRIILKRSPGDPNEVSLDAIVSGFLHRESSSKVSSDG